MRNLQFRAWDEAKKIWIPGADGFHILGEHLLIGGLFTEYNWDNWKDIIIEQFSGIIDESRKEVYEGDIIDIDSDFFDVHLKNMEVFWNEPLHKFDVKPRSFETKYRPMMQRYIQQHCRCRIVGNIHETVTK
jgi:hypothetical protein